MIKLYDSLPNTIEVEGREFLVRTDYRYWLLFYRIVSQGKFKLGDLYFLFKDEMPQCDFIPALVDFFENPNSTPKSQGGNKDKAIDYIEDGEYIYASFMQAYGIDLLKVNMHWHKFKALVTGLPKDTKMSEIMALRTWTDDKRKIEEIYKDLKRAWALPKQIDMEKIKERDEFFG